MPSTTRRPHLVPVPEHPEQAPEGLTTRPDDGFGRLWRREFRVDLGALDPHVVVADWKEHFDEYWPAAGSYHRERVREGDVAPVEVGAPGPGPAVRTAVVVVHEDADSFVFVTPRGHMFAGVIAFSAHADQGRTTATVAMRIRPNDPLYELGWPVIRRMEDRFWSSTLRNLAEAFGVEPLQVPQSTTLLDGRRIWSHWGNIRHNAALHSAARWVSAPLRNRRQVLEP
jgi:hypothetical protein